MSERVSNRLADKHVAKDIRVVTAMIEVYCGGNHAQELRVPLESDAVQAGVYGAKAPILCEECANLARYAEKRRIYCPKDPKPFCAYCDIHCYAKGPRATIREVMRYAGPRTMGTRHFFAALRHAWDGRMAKRAHKARLKQEGVSEEEFRRRQAAHADSLEHDE